MSQRLPQNVEKRVEKQVWSSHFALRCVGCEESQRQSEMRSLKKAVSLATQGHMETRFQSEGVYIFFFTCGDLKSREVKSPEAPKKVNNANKCGPFS